MCTRPLFFSQVEAGFPSPAEDYIDRKIDLNQELIRSPSSTYFLRVGGRSMEDANIYEGDILIVDRAVKATPNNIVVAIVNSEFTVKKLIKRGNDFFLESQPPEYISIRIRKEMDVTIWGVVLWIIHSA